MEGTLGEIRLFAGNFAPRNWAFCEGQLIAISQNQSLYAVLGTIYGGDGRTTFGLPDLRSRVAVGTGHGLGLSQYPLGYAGGQETNRLSVAQLPTHAHTATFSGTATTADLAAFNGTPNESDGNNATSVASSNGERTPTSYLSNEASNASIKNSVTGITSAGTIKVDDSGSSQMVENRQPYMAMNYIICMEGLFPSRN